MLWQPPPTSAHVDISTGDNMTFQDAFQFDDPTVTIWDFVGKTFHMDIKANREASTPLLSVTSGSGQIVVDDTVLRILHFNVADSVLNAAMPPGNYVYDLVMTNGSSVKTQIMHGEFNFTHGVTAP